jgi:hypothetical protein
MGYRRESIKTFEALNVSAGQNQEIISSDIQRFCNRRTGHPKAGDE